KYTEQVTASRISLFLMLSIFTSYLAAYRAVRFDDGFCAGSGGLSPLCHSKWSFCASVINVALEPVFPHRSLVCKDVITRRDQRSRLIDLNNHDRSNPAGRVKHAAIGEGCDMTV